MSFDSWLDARDGEALAAAWATLGAKEVPVGDGVPHVLHVTDIGVAHLAGAFLGCAPERFAWFESYRGHPEPAPVFEVSRTVHRCFLDGKLDFHHTCIEDWRIHEVIEGTRGVQYVQILYSYDLTGERGSSGTVIRLFDRAAARAVSIPVFSRSVWMIGEPIDLAPMLFTVRVPFRLAWTGFDLDAVRGLVAQLTTDLDAHFDTSPTWAGGLTDSKVHDESSYWVRTSRYAFEAGPHALKLEETLQQMDCGARATHSMVATVHGLPWGHEVRARIERIIDAPAGGADGWVEYTVPRPQVAVALARLAMVPGLEVTS